MLPISKSQLPLLSSSSIIANNEDLLTEILSRLPIKPLFQFKCGSKNWFSLISNPLFLHRKTANLCKNISRLFVSRQRLMNLSMIETGYDIIPLDENKVSTSFSKPLISSDHPMQILQSCNGLLLCCHSNGKREYYSDFFVCIPTTKRFKTIPDPIYRSFDIKYGIESSCAAYLAFDPRKSSYYKVICIYLSKKFEEEMEIYSSETGVWKRIHNSFPAEVNLKIDVYWNGAINWFSSWEGDGLYFNINEERFGKIPMLPLPNGLWERKVMHFGESNDHLHLIENYGPCTAKFNVYEMDKEYTGWFVRYRIDIGKVMNAFPESICSYLDPSDLHYYRFKLLCFVQGGKNEESFIVQGKVVRYNIGDETVQKIWDFDQGECDYGSPICFSLH